MFIIILRNIFSRARAPVLNIQSSYILYIKLNGMEHAFQTCAHCGTLNFEGRKICSCCKFRLPETANANAPENYRRWNVVIVAMVLIAIAVLLAAAFVIDPY
jgi:hypothetical protein